MLNFTLEVFRCLANQNRGHIRVMLECTTLNTTASTNSLFGGHFCDRQKIIQFTFLNATSTPKTRMQPINEQLTIIYFEPCTLIGYKFNTLFAFFVLLQNYQATDHKLQNLFTKI